MSGKSPGAKRRRFDKNASSPDALLGSSPTEKRSLEIDDSADSLVSYHLCLRRINIPLQSHSRLHGWHAIGGPGVANIFIAQDNEGEVVSSKRLKTGDEKERKRGNGTSKAASSKEYALLLFPAHV